MKYQLYNKATIDKILGEAGFTFKKSLGQNFLTDPEVCPAMAAAAADKDTGVIEIGPGIGVLTAELCEVAKKVTAIELDERLRPVLAKTLADFENVRVIFSDVLKVDLKALIKDEFSDCKRIAVCANLPYYITSPIIMALLEERLPIESITVMVQKEAADRFTAKIPGRDVGAVTLSAAYYAESETLFDVGRESFTPSPNVDSAVITFKIRKEPPVALDDEKRFFGLVRSAFLHRRKTFVNSVSACGFASKEDLCSALDKINVPLTVRAEQLSLSEFAEISRLI